MCISPKMGVLRPPKPLSLRNATEEERFFSVLRASNQRVEALRLQREQEFLRNEPAYAMELKIEQLRCPLHLFRFRQSLEQLAPGQILKLQTGSKALIADLEAACRIMDIETQLRRYRRRHFLYATRPAQRLAGICPVRRETTEPEIEPAGRMQAC